MSGIGEAASVIAIIDVAAKVIAQCREYYREVKDARKDIQRLRDEVTTLQNVLTSIADLADSSDPADLSIFDLVHGKDGPLQQSRTRLENLVSRLDPGQGTTLMKSFGMRALKWPLSSKDVQKHVAAIREERMTFNLALTGDQFHLTQRLRQSVAEVSHSFTEFREEHGEAMKNEQKGKISRWLSAPDPSSNYHTAREKQQATTGDWFIEGIEFANWKIRASSFLWLHGIRKAPVLSTIVHNMIDYCASNQDSHVIYFFFDFNDVEKQKSENLIRSLITQFLFKSPDVPEFLNMLFSQSQSGSQQPSLGALISALRQLLDCRHDIFLILDALDECSDREELLDLIKTITDWRLENVHILATSRKEADISEMIDTLYTSQIPIQNESVNADIQTYILERLKGDQKLKKWPERVQSEIKKTLMEGAHGMFRWVVCQLDEIRKCLKVETLRNTLRSLPKDLDSTYGRILCNINEQHRKDALTILLWLTFSMRPLRIEEVAEATAINLECSPQFNEDRRLRDPHDVLEICSSLVTLSSAEEEVDGEDWDDYDNGNDSYDDANIDDDDNDDNEDDDTPKIMERSRPYFTQIVVKIRLAHFSVKEYLVSDRIRLGPASYFDLNKDPHAEIARACLVYLQNANIDLDNLSQSPLANYAAKYSCDHAKLTIMKKEITGYFMDFFENQEAFTKSIQIYHPDEKYYYDRIYEPISPLYYASVYGMVEILRQLLCNGVDPNGRSGFFGSPLQAACIWNNEVVKVLLDHGADINIQSGVFGNALHAACSFTRYEIVKLFIDWGANINAQGYYGNALRGLLAGSKGLEGDELIKTTKLLLDQGANVNAQGGEYGTALQAAALNGQHQILQLLLNSGANVNAQEGPYGTALQAAAAYGQHQAVQLLLDSGADVNAQSGDYGTALQAAARFGQPQVVQLLLDSGANVNAQSGKYGTALQAAAGNGRHQVVQLLLDSGADGNAQSGKYCTALQAACAVYATYSEAHCVTTVKLLLDKGANVNTKGGKYGTALEAALVYGRKSVAQLLLDWGADADSHTLE
ncbi:MAG: hypothetical protein Q9167_007486 [Letrouitia subvulpina]